MPSDGGMGLRLIATETDCTVGAGDEVASERLRTYLRRLDVDSFCAADRSAFGPPGLLWVKYLPSTCIAHETVRPSLSGERRGK